MNEATECLKIYMNNRRIGQHISQEYLDMVNVLIESCVIVQGENTQLKQQLKDKDEKISNLIKLLVEMVFDDINYLGVYQELVARHLVKLGYIVKEDGFYKELESNKED